MPPLLQCTIYKTMDNQDVWAYDKRFHTALEESLTVPAIEAPPAFQARSGWLQRCYACPWPAAAAAGRGCLPGHLPAAPQNCLRLA